MKNKVLLFIAATTLIVSFFSACSQEQPPLSSTESFVSSDISQINSIPETSSDDPFEAIVNSLSDALEGKKTDKNAICDWNGKYKCLDTAAVMNLGQIDGNSFEFTVTNGEYELKEQVARIYGNLAIYENTDENVKLVFVMDTGKINIIQIGENNGIYYGEYSPV